MLLLLSHAGRYHSLTMMQKSGRREFRAHAVNSTQMCILSGTHLVCRETIFMTPSSSHGAAAPLMGTAGVRNLFFPAIDEELEDGEPDAEPPTASFAQLAVSGRPAHSPLCSA